MIRAAESDLLDHLRALETELRRIETRRNRNRLERLLHRDFVEIGRSGRRYDRAAILSEFAAGGELPTVHAQDFELAELDPGIALLTYRSAHLDSDGKLHHFSLRSSLWVRTDAGWQVRFHQGTATGDSMRAELTDKNERIRGGRDGTEGSG